MDLRDTYNRIASYWHEDHSHDTWWRPGLEKFVSFLKPGARVLDAGCGSGVKAKELAVFGFEITGVDISEKLLDIAKREVPSGTFLEKDMRDIGSMDEMFDGVFAQASLLHIPKKEVPSVLEGLVSRLNPGGVLYIAVKEQREGTPEEKIVTEDDYGFTYERFFSFYTGSELREYLTQSGLTVVYEDRNEFAHTSWLQIIGQKQ